MSLRIQGAPPAPSPALRRPEPPRPFEPAAAPEAAPVTVPAARPPEPALDQWTGSGEPAAAADSSLGSAAPQPTLPGSTAASAGAQAAAEAAYRTAERVRQETQSSPAQAARIHANLVPATVLNLLG